ncbi:MAG: GspH/FimT family pseudopilin [Burkholderiaceae bacterium]|nr:GspH/FimT family pseudopilin [Burkholderiaceae bacterium]
MRPCSPLGAPGAPHRRPRTEAGLTAIEILVTLAILGVLAGLASPHFLRMMERWQVQQAIDALTATLYFARAEALQRGGRIAIQKTPQNTDGCTQALTNQEWGCGWFVFEDSNNDGRWQKTETKLHTTPPMGRVDVIHSSGGIAIKVDRFGKMSGLNAKGFIVSPLSDGVASPATRGLCMASGGRIRVTEQVPCT